MLKKVFFLASADSINKIAAYLLVPVYLALMSKAEFGEASFLFYVSAPLITVLSLGMYAPLIKELSTGEGPSKEAAAFTCAAVMMGIWLALISGLVVSGILLPSFGLIFSVTSLVYEKLLAYGLLVVAGVGNLYIYALLMARNNNTSLMRYTTFRFVVGNGASLCFLYYGFSGGDASLNRILGFAAGDALAFLIYLIGAGRVYFRLPIDLAYVRPFLLAGISILPAGITAFVTGLYDRHLIATHWGILDLADYNLAAMLASPIYVATAAVQAVFAPNLFGVKSKEESYVLTKKILVVTLVALLFLSILISCIVFLGLAASIIPQDYEKVAAYTLPVCAIAALVSVWNIPSNLFIMYNKPRHLVFVSISGFGLCVFLLYLLVPKYGVYGAIAANMVAAFASLVLLTISAKLSFGSEMRVV